MSVYCWLFIKCYPQHDFKSWDGSKFCELMELTYFYKAEMPNFQDWTLDISELKILWIWDRGIQTTIK